MKEPYPKTFRKASFHPTISSPLAARQRLPNSRSVSPGQSRRGNRAQVPQLLPRSTRPHPRGRVLRAKEIGTSLLVFAPQLTENARAVQGLDLRPDEKPQGEPRLPLPRRPESRASPHRRGSRVTPRLAALSPAQANARPHVPGWLDPMNSSLTEPPRQGGSESRCPSYSMARLTFRSTRRPRCSRARAGVTS